MNRFYLLTVILSFFLSVSFYGQEHKPDWRKLHYLSEEEMNKEFDNTLNFYETDPPVPPVRNVAEFDPMQAVVVRYPFGIPMTLVKEMADDIEVITIVTNQSQEQTVLAQYAANNVNTANCSFLYAPSDSYWTRDYGPWFVFDGNNEPGIVNFPYNRPRPNDNDIPIRMAEYLDIELYGMNLSHTGGNYMTDGMGKSASTDLVWEENAGLSHDDIDTLVKNYLGVENFFVLPDPLDDYIKHIDCWGKFLSPGKVLIGQVPASDYRYEDFEAAANFFKTTLSSYGKPYEVHRVFTPGTYPNTPYTNSLILNNKVFVPLTGSQWDDEAIASYEEAMPGYEVVGITYSGWLNTDAIHCRTKGVADLEMLYIHHVPVLGKVPTHSSYEISADFISYGGADIYADSTLIYYNVNGGDFTTVLMEHEAGTTWTGTISGLSSGDHVDYYLYVADESGRHTMHPFIGGPDPHEFNLFGLQADVLELTPDTLLFLTFEDCVNGLPLHVINISSDSVELTEITQYSVDEGFYWEVVDMPELPFMIGSDDTLTLTVTIGIPVRSRGEMMQDTLFVETSNDVYSALILVDSDLVSGIEEIDGSIRANVYPNPFSRQLHVDLDLTENNSVQFTLFDLSGRKVYAEQGNYHRGKQSLVIDADRLGIQPGTYLYRLIAGEKTQTGKLIYRP